MPSHSLDDGRSPRKRTAKTATSTRLSLSTGATLDASPTFRARKQQTQDAPVASPDGIRKSQVFGASLAGLLHLPVRCTNPARTTRMTTVRTSVARSESTPARPIFAKMAVRAANAADHRAQ